MKKLLFTIAIVLSFSFFANAEYTLTCKIKYKKEYDIWSDYYKVEVHFLSGYELNQKTHTTNYDHYNVYAVIFWSKEKATVIKLTSTMLCSPIEVQESCITNKLFNLEGNDQEGRSWEICVKSTCY